MARLASTTDLVVPVDGIGTFTFAKKAMRDMFAIETEFARLTEGVEEVHNFLFNVATAFANLKVLTVTAPDDWDLDALDPEEGESYMKLMQVWGALRDKQTSFRKAAAEGREGAGAGPIVQP